MKYFGTYEDFSLNSKDDAGALIGADNAIGDIYDIRLDMEGGNYVAHLVNRFGHDVGIFDSAFSKKLALMAADGMTLKAILSLVAYNDEKLYWGNVAVICFDPAYSEEFDRYIQNVADMIARDIRPKIDIEAEAVEKIVESDGEWVPSQRITISDIQDGMTIVKRKRNLTEKIIDQGRARNKGCYVASWAIIICFVVLIALAVKTCAGF